MLRWRVAAIGAASSTPSAAFTHEIWRRLSLQSKRRFSSTPGRGGTSTATAWRRRSSQRIAAAIAAGALTIVAGKILRRRGDSARRARSLPAAAAKRAERTMQVAEIVEVHRHRQKSERHG